VAFEHKSNDNGNFLTRLLMGYTRVICSRRRCYW
jgi:hypothetical protein